MGFSFDGRAALAPLPDTFSLVRRSSSTSWDSIIPLIFAWLASGKPFGILDQNRPMVQISMQLGTPCAFSEPSTKRQGEEEPRTSAGRKNQQAKQPDPHTAKVQKV